MPRSLRGNMKDSSFFHIMVQGINKEFIFKTKRNMQKYVDLIYKNNEGVNIIAYCIMGNHAHVLIETNQIENMAIWMQKTNTSYARYYNKLNNRVGYVFRDRYKVQVIKNPEHLYTCVEYIHNNPVKAGICQHKTDYEYSSYLKIYAGDEAKIRDKLNDILNGYNLNARKEELKEEFILIEEEELSKQDMCNEIVNQFLSEKNLNIRDLRKHKDDLKEIVRTLKHENNISYRMMEQALDISRETLRNINNNM